MLVVPAIDLRGGKCVRLLQGDYDRETTFEGNPPDVALQWQAAGAELIHIVDLDGARNGAPSQVDIIEAIVDAIDIPIQVGGGLRTLADAELMFAAGAARIVLGTVAIEQPELVAKLLERHGPDRIVVGVDARNGMVATRGWTETSSTPALDLIRNMQQGGVGRIVYTDIARDGTLTSPNFEALNELSTLDLPLVASGGVASVEHLHQLAAIPNVVEAIVGMALYSGAIALEPGEWRIGGGK